MVKIYNSNRHQYGLEIHHLLDKDRLNPKFLIIIALPVFGS